MKKLFPYISLAIGLFFSFILIAFSPMKTGELPSLPLLAALYMSELGMIMVLVGAWMSGRDAYAKISTQKNIVVCVGNLLLAVNLFLAGLKVWPDTF